jgi:TRAP-type mannitol/chloroaromatic compound transport system permease small subunit
MDTLLAFSRAVDALNRRLGLLANWLVLLACLISAGNAFMRYGFNLSSNAWLEIQWYLFGAMVLLGASYTLKVNEHVRVDLLYGNVSRRVQLWIDLLGGVLFLLPATVILAWLSWPLFANSFALGETSSNAGGLLRWPVKLLLPAGFALLTLQGLSEIVKRAAAIAGRIEIDGTYQRPVQ